MTDSPAANLRQHSEHVGAGVGLGVLGVARARDDRHPLAEQRL
jgi:hypothetical protein